MNTCLMNLRRSAAYYQEIVDDITNVLGIAPIDVYESDTDNACATFWIDDRGIGNAVISYNADFMGRLANRGTHTVIGVLAHEIGHHFNLDLLAKKGWGKFEVSLSHRQELNADRFAGYMLAYYGFSQEEALDMAVVFDWLESDYHPGRSVRERAIRMGWTERKYGASLKRRVERPLITQETASVIGFTLVCFMTILAGVAIARRT